MTQTEKSQGKEINHTERNQGQQVCPPKGVYSPLKLKPSVNYPSVIYLKVLTPVVSQLNFLGGYRSISIFVHRPSNRLLPLTLGGISPSSESESQKSDHRMRIEGDIDHRRTKS